MMTKIEFAHLVSSTSRTVTWFDDVYPHNCT